MEIMIGPLCFDHACIVADMVDEVLLGEDLLLCDSSGPANIIIIINIKFIFTGATIPLTMVRQPVVIHVIIVESVEVSPMEEVIVDA